MARAKVFKSGNSMAIRISSEVKLRYKEYKVVPIDGGEGFQFIPIGEKMKLDEDGEELEEG